MTDWYSIGFAVAAVVIITLAWIYDYYWGA